MEDQLFLEPISHVSQTKAEALLNALNLPKDFGRRLNSKDLEAEQSVYQAMVENLDLSPPITASIKNPGVVEILSDVHGEVKQILMTCPLYTKGKKIHLERIEDMLQRFDNADFIIATKRPPLKKGEVMLPTYRNVTKDLTRVAKEYGNTSRSVRFIGTENLRLGVSILKNIKEPALAEVTSNVHGKIKQIFMTCPLYPKERRVHLEHIEDMFKKFESVDFIIVTKNPPLKKGDTRPPSHNNVTEDLTRIAKKYNNPSRNIHFINSIYYNFSHWIRDPFLIANDLQKKRSLFLTPNVTINREPLASDFLITQYLDKTKKKTNTKGVPFLFHGGNILVGDTFILMGTDYLSKEQAQRNDFNQKQSILSNPLNVSNEDLKAEIRKYLSPIKNKKIILIGKTPPKEFNALSLSDSGNDFSQLPIGLEQPLFHLDLFITLLGRNEQLKYQIALAEIVDASDNKVSDIEKNIISPLNQWLDEVKLYLKSHDFEVHRVETPITYFNLPEGTTEWRILSYNNSIVEVSKENRHLWLPTYGSELMDKKIQVAYNINLIAEYDAKAIELFKKLNFKVTPLMNYFRHMIFQGAAHCITNILRENQ